MEMVQVLYAGDRPEGFLNLIQAHIFGYSFQQDVDRLGSQTAPDFEPAAQ